MPEATVTKGGHGLPFSKGLMAQSLQASGVAPERAYELARLIERRLATDAVSEIDVATLRGLTAEVLGAEEGESAVRRFRDWQRLNHLDRPLIVRLAGTAGVGKSTVATMLAGRLGITRVIPTDAIRQVLRACFSPQVMPAVHYSSFEAARAVELTAGGGDDGDIVGFARQAETVAAGVTAIIDRAALENTGMVIEGVHLVPGMLDRERLDCLPVDAVIAIGDEDLHRAHFSRRGGNRPAERYLDRFDQIRKLQSYLTSRARAEGVPVIDNPNIDEALSEVMGLVLEAVGAEAQP